MNGRDRKVIWLEILKMVNGIALSCFSSQFNNSLNSFKSPQNCVFNVPFRLQYLQLQRRSSVSWLQTWPPWQAGYNLQRFSPLSAQTGFKPHSHILRWREHFVLFEWFEEYVRPGSRGSRPPWCHCRGWWPSMAQWGADLHTLHGPSGLSASAWCSTAEAITTEYINK